MNNRVFSIAVMLAALIVHVFAGGIERIDIFDSDDNHLLFVTFNYDGSGTCIGRSVFASDSTFLRSISFTSGGAASATTETSTDFNDNKLFTTTVNPPSGGTTSFSTIDQFGMSQFGSPLSYSETAENTFTVSQDKATLCKEKYEFDADGKLTRISVSDKSGAPAWYALVTHQGVATRQKPLLRQYGPIRLSANRGKILLQMNLFTPGFVRAELITPAGRRARILANKRMATGTHSFSTGDALLGNGTYIVKVTLDAGTILTRMIVVQR